MESKQIAPFGSWESPVSTELVVGRMIGLSPPVADGDDLYWVESRPTEAGRSVLVRRSADGTVADITPAPFNIGTRVHEYGGGALAIRNGWIVFSERRSGHVWLIAPGAAPRAIVAVDGCRYADFSFVPGRDAVVSVREDHRGGNPTAAAASLVLLDLALTIAPAENAGTVLLRGPDFLSSPRVSPDGGTLAWIAWNHPDMPWDATTLSAAPLGADGTLGPARVVAGGPGESVLHPAWSPDGALHFCSDRSGWWNIFRERDGAAAPVTALDAEIGGPHWVFGQRYFGFLPDGRLLAGITAEGRTRAAIIADGAPEFLPLGPVAQCPAVLASAAGTLRLACLSLSAAAPAAIVIAELANGAPLVTPLRTAGPAALRAEDISMGEPFDFAAADGGTAHAFWYPPVNARFAGPAGGKPPLVVMIHGGPTAMTTDAFRPGIQWWTSRGFGVVDVNYRGSTGFGRAFMRKLDGAWGVADVEDCIAAARHLVTAGRADGERLLIRGGSAGGFTALAVLTASAGFAGGASLYGVADLRLLAADTHKFESRYLDRLLGPLPEAEAMYVQRSPISRLDRLAGGVIFFQGLDDKVVPPNQARVMVAAMQARGLPVAHVEFAGEDHGFRKAETLTRVLELELDFYGKLCGFTPPGLSERVTLLG